MQSSNQFSSHKLSESFIMQFNNDKNKLYADYKNLLAKFTALEQAYSKAFDPTFCPAWNDNKERFKKIKKPIAMQLVQYAKQLNTVTDDPGFFITYLLLLKNKLKVAIRKNNESDPVSFLDGWRKKPTGGELGKQLALLADELRQVILNKDQLIHLYSNMCKQRLTYLYSALAFIREKKTVLKVTEYFQSTTKPIPLYCYYESVIKDLDDVITDSALVEYVNKKILKFSFTIGAETTTLGSRRQQEIGLELDTELQELEDQCIHLINDVKLIFFEVNLFDQLQEAPSHFIRNNDVMTVLKRFLLTDFANTFSFVERDYCWSVIIKANNIGVKLNTEESILKVRNKFHALVTQNPFWVHLENLYRLSQLPCYGGQPTISLLHHSTMMAEITNEEFIKSETLKKDFAHEVSAMNIPLNRILNDEQKAGSWQQGWKQMDGYQGKFQWSEFINTVFQKEVLDPINLLAAWVDDPNKMNANAKVSYLGQLLLRANQMMQSTKNDVEVKHQLTTKKLG